MSDENDVKLAANFKNRKPPQDDPRTKYEKAVDEFKALLEDKIHPSVRTISYSKNVKEVLNRLLIAADEYDGISPGSGVFGLIVLALRSNLALKDKFLESQNEIKELKLAIKRLEKRNG